MQAVSAPNLKRKRDEVEHAVAMLNGMPFDTTMMAHQEVYHISNLNGPNTSTTLTFNKQSSRTPPITPPDYKLSPSMGMDDGNGNMYMMQQQSVYTPPKRQFRRSYAQTPAEQEEEGRIMRLKNKEAAHKCREKKKLIQQEQEMELVRLREETHRLAEENKQMRASIDQLHKLLAVHEQCDHPEMRSHFAATRNAALLQSQEAYAQLYQDQMIGYPQDVYPSPVQMHPHELPENGYAMQQPMMSEVENQVLLLNAETAPSPSDSAIVLSPDENYTTRPSDGTADMPTVFEHFQQTPTPWTEMQASDNTGLSEEADGKFEYFN